MFGTGGSSMRIAFVATRSQVLERGAVDEALLHAAERALERQRRGGAPGTRRVLPGAHVQQPADRREAEPDAGEAESLPVLVVRQGAPTPILPMAVCCDRARSAPLTCSRALLVPVCISN